MAATVARERLAEILGGITAPGAFSAKRTAPTNDLHLEVRGIEPVSLPVSPAQAEELYRLGRPARYGKGERTLLDRRVRDTVEIPKSRVRIDKRRWNRTLLPVLDHLREGLGLPSDCRLKAELHSMLVYGPGQFFVPHQDSEKADDMVGSLVLTLPGTFSGGSLVVEHRGEVATYRAPKRSLSFVAFYADCRHEVRPVTSGHRIVLTYNLLLRGDVDVSAVVLQEAVDGLAGCLDEHLTTPVPTWRRSTGPEAAPPDRLVYLLDHEYTKRGLSWTRLKGNDRVRAAALRAAAEATDCELVLALAEVHETWSCYGPEWDEPWRSGRRHRSWDDDLDDEAAWSASGDTGLDDYDLEELIDGGITLDGWIGPDGERPEAMVTSVRDIEVCATTPSMELQPHASEYEGYMGNYGNTMDRWYRRGALVVWPRRRGFAVRAEASPAWALGALTAQIRTGDLAGARTHAATLSPFWRTVVGADPRREVFTMTLRVTHELDEPRLAAWMLEPFPLELLTPRDAPALTALVERYGQAWAGDLLTAWSTRQQRWPSSAGDRRAWVALLDRLCEALTATGDLGARTARQLADGSWRWLREEVERRRVIMPPSTRDERLGELADAVRSVLVATAVLDAPDLRDEVVGFLCAGDELLSCLLPLLRDVDGLSVAERDAAGLDAVARHCAERLVARLRRRPRADDDWSIDVAGGCGCDLCATLDRFLADRTQRTFEWPLAKNGRRHVHGRIDGAELPVTHQTRRKGRPYTLVLTKTPALFERDLRSRDRDEADRAWIERAWGPFVGLAPGNPSHGNDRPQGTVT